MRYQVLVRRRRSLPATPLIRISRHLGSAGWCTCDFPRPYRLGMFPGAVECRSCGRPPLWSILPPDHPAWPVLDGLGPDHPYNAGRRASFTQGDPPA